LAVVDTGAVLICKNRHLTDWINGQEVGVLVLSAGYVDSDLLIAKV
jgi:hypothetical protein